MPIKVDGTGYIGTSNNIYTDANGRVGIGTTTPTNLLEVAGSSPNIYLRSNDSGDATLRYMSASTERATVRATSANALLVETGGVERMRVDGSGMLLPGANGSYDLGSTSLRWRNIYTNDLNLSNGIGDYTVVEGEEDLFLYNNKSGKVFKFALIEVDPSEAPKKAE